jgi:hypothetical protein
MRPHLLRAFRFKLDLGENGSFVFDPMKMAVYQSELPRKSNQRRTVFTFPHHHTTRGTQSQAERVN